MLVVSQFTLLGDVRKGRRPSFDAAAAPEEAGRFTKPSRLSCGGGARCEDRRFQTDMDVELVNDGPVTILVDSRRQF